MTVAQRLTGAFWLLACSLAIASSGYEPTLVWADDASEELIRITIHARQFDPPSAVLHAGRKTHVVLHNEDAELHAFVPVGLFVGVSLNVGGNGAPEFDDHGFKKVIIPSGGHADIRFTPERLGTYQYLCDMPGHEMRGTIQVE
jgi:plastocyanin